MPRLQKMRLGWLFGCVAAVLCAASSGAVTLNDARTMELTGQLETRFSIRTEDSESGTDPAVDAGDWVQHRNLALLEFNHDLKRVAGLDVKYRIVGRAVYEGVYNYGADQFRDIPNENYVKDIDDFKKSAEIWEAYVDVSRGPAHLRLGRQNLAWGETDLVRILDSINPLDNTFGGIYEDIDDRRIPLWMARGDLGLGNLGPLSSLALEGFLVPGMLDATVSPNAPPGTVYAPPATPGPPPPPGFLREDKPDKEWDSSRWGVRLQGYLGGVSWAVAYQRTFLDFPRTRFVEDVPGDPMSTHLEFDWDRVDILGGSFNYYMAATDMIVRGELGYFWDANQNVAAVNTPWVPTGMSAPFPPVVPAQGEFVERDEIRYSLSVDKGVWIRPLNKHNQWDFTLQYAGTKVLDYDDDLMTPGYTNVLNEYEHNLTLIIMNLGGWFSGSLLPEIVANYDFRGIWFIQPALSYKWGDHLRTKLTYSRIQGQRVNVGTFRDRDQVSLNLGIQF